MQSNYGIWYNGPGTCFSMWTWNINNRKIVLPTSWYEVTTRDYQRIKGVENVENKLQVFSALVNIPFDHIMKSKDEELSMTIYQIVAFIFNSPEYFRFVPCPEQIQIGDKLITIPKELEKLTVEQNIMLRTKMDDVKYMEQIIAFACAVYLQPFLDETPFSADRVSFWEKHIEGMPIEYTFPIGFFFLSRINSYGQLGWLYLTLKRIQALIWRRKLPRWRTLKNLKDTPILA